MKGNDKCILYNASVTNNDSMSTITLYECNINIGMHRIYQNQYCSSALENTQQVNNIRIDDLLIIPGRLDFV